MEVPELQWITIGSNGCCSIFTKGSYKTDNSIEGILLRKMGINQNKHIV